MSANNYIRIKNVQGEYELVEGDADSGSDYEVSIGKFKTRDEAITRANKYMEEEIVEYGIRHIDL